jgi:hypothetical protein
MTGLDGGSRAREFYLPDALYVVGNNRFEREHRAHQRGIAIGCRRFR